MSRLRLTLFMICALLVSSAAIHAETTDDAGAGVVSSRNRFSGPVVKGRKGKGPLSVHYQIFSLAPGTSAATSPPPNSRVLELPLEVVGGIVIFELRAGKLTTIINGKRQPRREGEFWSLQPGEDIVLEA